MPKEEKKETRLLKFAQISMVHGFPKIQKQFDRLPILPISVVTTTSTPYY